MEHAFLDALAKAGIPPSHPLVFDGKLRRYHVVGQKKGKKNGWYRYTRLRDDLAFASFGCNKTGINDKWISKEKREYTKYDQSLIRKRQAEIKAEEERRQAEVAIKAGRLWDRLRYPAHNEYAARKGVGLYNVRQLRNMLVVPVYSELHIVSLQFIPPDGAKLFLTDGKMRGSYGMIGDETDTLYIVEGYATGASVHEATGQMVALAFFAGNILPVAQAMRELFPDKKIIIAADNDQWTERPRNPGLSAAREAADKIGAKVVYPDFSYEDKQRPTDWNDYHLRHGMDALRTALQGVVAQGKKAPAVVAQADDKEWRKKLLEGKEERIGYPLFDPKSKQNAYLFMTHHEAFRDLLAYNVFTNQIIIRQCPPWERPHIFMPRSLIDTDASMFVKELECLGIKTSKDVVFDYIDRIAHDNEINPPRDYFASLEWDGRARLDTWLTYYLGAETQPAEYLRLVGTKWIMGAVARVFKPGAKFDNVLVLEGAQGIKKTTALEALATFNGENFFLEFSGDVMNKDSLAAMQGKIIVEMSELASVRKSEVEEMKAFVSRRVDEYRPPYGRLPIKRPRFFILGATTNKMGQEYLEDETGNRRIWPVACGDQVDLDSLRRDSGQLWAEAIHRYQEGERIWLEGDEVQLVLEQQHLRQAEDPWVEQVERYLGGGQGMPLSETTAVKAALGIGLTAKDLQNTRLLSRIKSALTKCGWEERRPEAGDDSRGRIWRRKQ